LVAGAAEQGENNRRVRLRPAAEEEVDTPVGTHDSPPDRLNRNDMEAYTRLALPPDDTPIWRYVSLEKLLSMLQARQLFFASLDRFEDQHEGVYPEAVWQSFVKPIYERLAVEKEGKLRLTEDELRRLPRKLFYVNCWYVNQHDSNAMWDLYSGRAGVAIKSTVGRLTTCISAIRMDLKVGLVRYLDFATVTDADIGRTPVWYLKRKNFEHEKELRAATQRSLSEFTHGVSAPVDLVSLIEEIVVEPRAGNWVTGVVSDLVRRYGFTFKVRRSDLYTLRPASS
jgi:hypothetical protein